jgi:hypothetical protein
LQRLLIAIRKGNRVYAQWEDTTIRAIIGNTSLVTTANQT